MLDLSRRVACDENIPGEWVRYLLLQHGVAERHRVDAAAVLQRAPAAYRDRHRAILVRRFCNLRQRLGAVPRRHPAQPTEGLRKLHCTFVVMDSRKSVECLDRRIVLRGEDEHLDGIGQCRASVERLRVVTHRARGAAVEGVDQSEPVVRPSHKAIDSHGVPTR